MDPSDDLEASLKDLSLSKKPAAAPSTILPRKEKPIADSWEDSADASSDEAEGQTESGQRTPASKAASSTPVPSPSYLASPPAVPPPTPASPRQAAASFSRDSLANSRFGSFSPSTPPDAERSRPTSSSSPSVRPEKTTATASRMIAAGLGIKAPKRTEEQRKYDRAAKEAEIRRKNQEKEAKKREEEERERAKAAIWDD